MILKVFSLLDVKSGIYSAPFFMAHHGMAVRACIDLAQDANTTVGRHPADFMLTCLGEFDDNSGTFEERREQIGLVVSMLPKPQMPLFRGEPEGVK